jgi:hypothetical protein
MHTAPAFVTRPTASQAACGHALPPQVRRPTSKADVLAQLESAHERGRLERAAVDALEERSLAWAMAGLVGGWWLGGPIGAMAGLMGGAIAAVWRS